LLDRSLSVISKGCLVLPVLTFALVRTGLREEPNQLNSLSPPCEMLERGSKASYEKRVRRLSPDLCPHVVKRGQGRTHQTNPPLPVLPGGRNSGRKAQKGPEKKKFGRKNLWPNYGRISSKVAEKGPRNFLKEFPAFTVMTSTQRR
jgi:hypothetical protein